MLRTPTISMDDFPPFARCEKCESGPRHLDKTNAPDLQQVHIDMAEERYTQDVETFADWVACASEEREPSVFWTSISSAELVRVGLSGKCTPEQAQQAWIELRKRYLADQDIDGTAWGFVS